MHCAFLFHVAYFSYINLIIVAAVIFTFACFGAVVNLSTCWVLPALKNQLWVCLFFFVLVFFCSKADDFNKRGFSDKPQL